LLELANPLADELPVDPDQCDSATCRLPCDPKLHADGRSLRLSCQRVRGGKTDPRGATYRTGRGSMWSPRTVLPPFVPSSPGPEWLTGLAHILHAVRIGRVRDDAITARRDVPEPRRRRASVGRLQLVRHAARVRPRRHPGIPRHTDGRRAHGDRGAAA